MQGWGSEAGEAVAPPRKRRKKKRKRPEDSDTAPLQEGQMHGQHWGPECRKQSGAELLTDGLEEEGCQRLVNGWQVGCGTDGPHVSNKKRRRKGTEGLGRGDCFHQDPPWHSCPPSDVLEPEATAASPGKKKKRKRKQESQPEGAGNERVAGWQGDRQRGSASPGSALPAVNGQRPEDRAGLEQAPLLSWNRERESDVVQELLKYSSDKAYGKKVLTWDGEVSAVSRDAVQDSRVARTATVIDDWDEEVDCGKEKKIRKFKREKKRNFNAFQKLQSRRNFWSATHPAKAASLSYRR